MFNVVSLRGLISKACVVGSMLVFLAVLTTLVGVICILRDNADMKKECSLILEDYVYPAADIKTFNGVQNITTTIAKGKYLCPNGDIRMEREILPVE